MTTCCTSGGDFKEITNSIARRDTDLEYIERLIGRLKKADRRYWCVMLVTLAGGIVIHGEILFNKFSFHDDMVSIFAFGSTISSGRWMLKVLWEFSKFFFRGSTYGLSTFNGVLTLLLAGITVCLIVRLLDIRRLFSCVLLSLMFITFPVFAGMMGYMYCAPPYMAAALMAAAGAVCISDAVYVCWSNVRRRLALSAAGIALICCATGVYQSYFPFAVSLLYLLVLTKAFQNRGSAKEFWKKAVYLLGSLCLSVGLYFIVLKIFQAATGIGLTDRADINTLGITSISGYIERMEKAVQEFLWPSYGSISSMYPMGMHALYHIVLAVAMIATLYYIFRILRAGRNVSSSGENTFSEVKPGHWLVRILILLALMPLAMNSIYLMIPEKSLRSLEMYSVVIVFAYFAWLYEKLSGENRGVRSAQLIALAGIVTLVLTVVQNSRYCNLCYLKAEFIQEQGESFFNRLITRIEETEGYSDDLPVAMLDEGTSYFSDQSFTPIGSLEEFAGVTTDLFDTSMPQNYSYHEFMKYWLGYNPNWCYDEETLEELKQNPEVEAMPEYPKDGSIRIIDGIIVVKF